VSFLSFAFILTSLVTFVGGQLFLKKAMESTSGSGERHPRFGLLLAAGIFLMTISFFLTLGLLQRFDLSYLYPFQGLSVVIISVNLRSAPCSSAPEVFWCLSARRIARSVAR
jgi:hypothetical protein